MLQIFYNYKGICNIIKIILLNYINILFCFILSIDIIFNNRVTYILNFIIYDIYLFI